jgi:rhomboid protease GluP
VPWLTIYYSTVNKHTLVFPPDSCLTKEKAHEWSLVLSAQGITHTLVNTPYGWNILIKQNDEERVRAELIRYEEENREDIPLKSDLPFKLNYFNLLMPFALLIIFHFVVVISEDRFNWRFAGHASNVTILDKAQWWRVFTALTLHSDSIHLLSNVILGAVITSSLVQQIGYGAGWLLIVASGGGGNFLNALFRAHIYASIGASTAVFGSLGLVVGLQLLESQRISWRRIGILIAAALALLGFLGTGKDTDIGAHLFGFLTGIPLGIITSVIFSRLAMPPGRRIQRFLALTALLIVSISWFFALTST